MKQEKRRILGLSQAEVEISPSWVRFLDKTKRITNGALIGVVFFIIVALVAGENAFPVPLIGLVVCGAWIGLMIITKQIGFLAYTLKNGDTGYFLRILLLGPIFWEEYVKKVMKPRLADSLTSKG